MIKNLTFLLLLLFLFPARGFSEDCQKLCNIDVGLEKLRETPYLTPHEEAILRAGQLDCLGKCSIANAIEKIDSKDSKVAEKVKEVVAE
jgi:hypothetical protein